MTFDRRATLLALPFLAACGGSSTPMMAPMGVSLDTFGTSDVSIVLGQNSGNVDVTANGTTSTFVRAPALDSGYYQAYQISGTPSIAFQVAGDDLGNGLAYIDPATNPVAVVGYGVPDGGYTSPVSGSVDLDGDYVSVLTDTGGQFSTRITGTASVTLLFNNPTVVSGGIYNRETYALADTVLTGIAANDILLNNATMATDGSFAGTTTGGSILMTGATAADGVYKGAITESSGPIAFGVLEVSHNDGTNNLIERGTFYAVEGGPE